MKLKNRIISTWHYWQFTKLVPYEWLEFYIRYDDKEAFVECEFARSKDIND